MVIEGTSVHTFAEGYNTRAYLYGVNIKKMVDKMEPELFTELAYYSAIRREREAIEHRETINEANNTEFNTRDCACADCTCDGED